MAFAAARRKGLAGSFPYAAASVAVFVLALIAARPIQLRAWWPFVLAAALAALAVCFVVAGTLLRMRRRLAELEAVLDSTDAGLALHDVDGHLLTVNRSGERLVPLSEADRERQVREGIMLPVLKARFLDGRPVTSDECGVARALRGEAADPMTVQVERAEPDAPPRLLSVSAAPVLDGAGEPTGIVSTFTDVTRLHEVLQQREDLLRAVAHDVRTPLQSILLNAAIVERGTGGPERARAAARSIVENTSRMSAAIKDVLETARLSAGQMRAKPEDVELRGFVAGMVRRLFLGRDLGRIRVEVPEGTRVRADPYHLERILTNLVTNALKYSAAGAPVHVRAEREGLAVAVAVVDEGPGIPADDQQRVFNRLFRGGGSSAKEGVGLGLYVARVLAEAQGGSVWLRSSPDAGSEFRVLLPGPREEAAASPSVANRPAPAAGAAVGGGGRAAPAPAQLDRAAVAEPLAADLADPGCVSLVPEEAPLATRPFLSKASRLLEESGDPDAMLEGVARLAAKHLGNWCTIALLDPVGRPRVVAVETADPAKADVARDLLETARNLGGPSLSSYRPDRYPIDLAAEHGLGRVLRTGQAELLPSVCEGVAGDLLRGVAVESFMAVPIRARGRLIGAIGFAVAGNARRLGERDLDTAEELARRCAIAVDNAEISRTAQEGERARDEAMAVVSHDLRGPLTNILMASRTLERVLDKLAPGGAEGDAARTSSRVVARCATRMTRLVDDLQDFASIEAGQLSVVRARQSPASVAREAVEAFQPMAEDNDVVLATDFAQGDLAVECDQDRIVQVLSNLLANAIHASPSRGTVTVSVAECDGQAVFSVKDAGPGIPPEELPGIFDRYQRGRSAQYKGAGLGLAIARKIVELHGGRIWVESALGRGSTFHFRLPAARRDARKDVLVVDDDTDLRCALRNALEPEGYHVALAANGRDAWEWLQSAPLPALILLDLMMPVMSGAELLALLRADTRLRSVPVVLVTAFGSLAEPVADESQGFLAKPFDIDKVLSLASRYCPPKAAAAN